MRWTLASGRTSSCAPRIGVLTGVLTEALRRGVCVPDHLAVISFGDLDFSSETDPSLTTVRINGGAIAREAVTMLIGPGGDPVSWTSASSS